MFSVIIPLYNKSKYIQRAVESVLKQSFENWEIIVVDDGSTDDSYIKVADFQSEKITLIQQKNNGVSASRNLAISLAKFNYIAFLDADDYWHPDYLYIMRKGIMQFPKSGIWGIGYSSNPKELCLNTGEFEALTDYFKNALWKTVFLPSAVVMDKSFFNYQEGFKRYLKRGEDLDVWFRAIIFFGTPSYCSDKMVFYEKGDEFAATKNLCHLNENLLGDIMDENYLPPNLKEDFLTEDFEIFRNKFIYYNIYKYFPLPESHLAIKRVLSQTTFQFPAVSLFYKLPFPLMTRLLSINFVNKNFRKYLTYCFKNIYT